MSKMKIKALFDERTWTMTYVVYDPESRDAVVIDPVLDYDPASSRVWTESAQAVVDFVKEEDLTLRAILETHAHADHLSASKVLRKAFPEAKLAIGARIVEVQEMFKGIFDLPADFPTDGSQFDMLLEEGQDYEVGTLSFDVINTPGHTPACVTLRFGDNIFTGDLLFMPDMGTGRCDFPGGSADDMYDSVQRIYELPDETQVWVGHDYQPGGRPVAWVADLGEHKEKNVALSASRSREDFVTWRQSRDSTLSAPKLLFQSVQVNVDGGRLPQPSDNEVRYLKIPINVFRPPEEGELSLDLV